MLLFAFWGLFNRAIWNQISAEKDILWKLNTIILILILYHFEKFYKTERGLKESLNLLSLPARERRWMAIIKLKFLRRVLVTAIGAWLTFWWHVLFHSVFECFETAKQDTCQRWSRCFSDILILANLLKKYFLLNTGSANAFIRFFILWYYE